MRNGTAERVSFSTTAGQVLQSLSAFVSLFCPVYPAYRIWFTSTASREMLDLEHNLNTPRYLYTDPDMMKLDGSSIMSLFSQKLSSIL